MPTHRCFVISPIGSDDSKVHNHANNVFKFIVQPAVEMSDFDVDAYRADHLHDPGRITDQMFQGIMEADFCIAVLTGHNPNVFYELAVAQAAGRPVIILIEKGDELPFDVKDFRSVFYDFDPTPLFEKTYARELAAHIESVISHGCSAEPLLARYGPSGGVFGLEGQSSGDESDPDLDLHCSGDLIDLLHVMRDGSFEPTPESDLTPFRVRRGRLRAFGSSAEFTFQADLEEPSGTSGFRGFARGRREGNRAFLLYQIEEREGEKNRCWPGVMVLRIPSAGNVIWGMWMTTGFLDSSHIALGTARLNREKPPES